MFVFERVVSGGTSATVAPGRAVLRKPLDTRRSASLAAASSVLVLLTASGFDLLAGETRDHVLGVAASAVAVGLMRLVLRGRMHGLFALINVALLAQPAAHALGKVADFAATQLPHEHLLPEGVPALMLQVAFTLLVVLVAGSEPILGFVSSSALLVLGVLFGLRFPAESSAATSCAVGTVSRALPLEVLFARCRPRRGPPASAGPLA